MPVWTVPLCLGSLALFLPLLLLLLPYTAHVVAELQAVGGVFRLILPILFRDVGYGDDDSHYDGYDEQRKRYPRYPAVNCVRRFACHFLSSFLSPEMALRIAVSA